jgi:hypothetical protein
MPLVKKTLYAAALHASSYAVTAQWVITVFFMTRVLKAFGDGVAAANSRHASSATEQWGSSRDAMNPNFTWRQI